MNAAHRLGLIVCNVGSCQAARVKKQLSILSLLATVALTSSTALASSQEALQPVAELDLERYTGTWYQLAAVPQIFSLQCAYDTTANYTAIDDATVAVKNRCRTWWGKSSGVDGKAVVLDAEQPAALRVSFDNIPFGQSAEGPANYIVTYIAPDYSWALVGSPNRSSGFVLSRKPRVSASRWHEIKSVIAERGYWDCAFLTSPTRRGYRWVTPLCAFNP